MLLGLAVLGFVLLGLAAGCSPAAPPQATPRLVRLAAASNVKAPLVELTDIFARAHPAIEIRTTHGSSGNFYAQLRQRAPFDVFLSADVELPSRLVKDGSAKPDSQFVYAIGQLALCVPRDGTRGLEEGLSVLSQPEVRRIAIANPRLAPYGRAAEAALRQAALYDAVSHKLVLGENVEQAAQFVHSGAADAGLVALSVLLAPAAQEDFRYVLLPDDAHPPLEQAAVILDWAQDPEAARLWCEFLRSTTAKEVWMKYGYRVPSEVR